MDSQEKNAEAQTTKVAEMESANGGDLNTDAPGDSKDDTSKEQPAQQGSPAELKAQSPAPTRRSPTPHSAEHSKRPSSRSPSPSTKRQRTSTSPSTSRHYQHPDRPARSPVRSPAPPTRRSPPPKARPDDKARTRRLFGGMLNTIAAKPSSRRVPYEAARRVDPAKREELERKAAEREKIRLKEEEDARRERELRRKEENRERYVRWERDNLLARWGNERVRAEYLRTNSKPVLYYKPYILTNDQKDTIERQVEDTELSIQAEIRKHEETHPDQDPLPWEPLATRKYVSGEDSPQPEDQQERMEEDARQVSPPPADSPKVEEQPVSKMDGAEEKMSEEQEQQHKKERTRTDEYDEEVIETEGGVSLIY